MKFRLTNKPDRTLHEKYRFEVVLWDGKYYHIIKKCEISKKMAYYWGGVSLPRPHGGDVVLVVLRKGNNHLPLARITAINGNATWTSQPAYVARTNAFVFSIDFQYEYLIEEFDNKCSPVSYD